MKNIQNVVILSKKDRLIRLIDHYAGGKQKVFAELLGIQDQLISAWLKRDSFNIELIYTKCRDISADWLLTGAGDMLKKVQDDIHLYRPDYEIVDTPQIPIISASLSQKTNTDVLQVVQDSTDGMEISKVHVEDMPVSIWWRAYDKSLEPEIRMGSKIALVAYHNEIMPRFGSLYGIDTYSEGLILRRLYPHPNGYIARSYNPTEYPDMIIPHDNIIRIYRAILEVRRL